MYSDEKFSRLDVRRSPPEPLTHKTSTSSPVSGSGMTILDEVLPPPVLVIRWSAPRIFERYTNRSTGSSLSATTSSQAYWTCLNTDCSIDIGFSSSHSLCKFLRLVGFNLIQELDADRHALLLTELVPHRRPGHALYFFEQREARGVVAPRFQLA